MARDLKSKGTEAFLFVIKECKVREEPNSTQPVPHDLAQLLAEFSDVLVKELPPGLPPSRETDHQVELTAGEHKPPYRPVYKMSPLDMEEARIQIEDLLKRGYIRPSKSPYGAPILFARKKNGKLHMCVDYRALNNITKKN